MEYNPRQDIAHIKELLQNLEKLMQKNLQNMQNQIDEKASVHIVDNIDKKIFEIKKTMVTIVEFKNRERQINTNQKRMIFLIILAFSFTVLDETIRPILQTLWFL